VLPIPLAGFKGPSSKGMEGRKKGNEEQKTGGESKGREGKERGEKGRGGYEKDGERVALLLLGDRCPCQ